MQQIHDWPLECEAKHYKHPELTSAKNKTGRLFD